MEEVSGSITFDASGQIQYHSHGHGSQICPTTGVSVINLEQCCICSVFFEQPQRPIPQTDLNRMICKVLDVVPDFSFFRDYLSICVNCANLLRKFDRLRVELEFVKTQLVTYVIESLTQMRDGIGGHGQLEGLKDQILNRWTNSGTGSKKNKKTGFSAAAGGAEKLDLSWAAHNNLMKNATEVDPIPNWSVAADASHSVVVHTEEARLTSTPIPSSPQYDDNDNYDDGGEDDIILDGNGDGDCPNTSLENDGNSEQKTASPKKKRKGKRKDGSPLPRKRKRPSKPKPTGGMVHPLICVICGRIFSKTTTYNGHVSVCDKDDSWIEKDCSLCKEELGQQVLFETWKDFKDHVAANHSRVPKLDKCQFCGLNLLPFGCKHHKCRGFGQQIDENPIFKCDVCDRAYNSRANLTDHVRRSHKDQKHTCDICGKTYGSPMLLKLHVDRHLRTVSKFKCSYCGICLASSYSLKHHTIAYHTKETPYQCKTCDRKFSTYTVYKHHQMVHTNKKPEICHLCGRGFKLKGTLRRHVVRHQLKETTHTKKCPLCPKGFFRKIWVLKKHMEAEHPGTAEAQEIFEKYKDVDDAPTDGKPRRIAPGVGRKYTNASKKIGTSKEDEDSESDYDDDESEDSEDEEGTETGKEKSDPASKSNELDVSDVQYIEVKDEVEESDAESEQEEKEACSESQNTKQITPAPSGSRKSTRLKKITSKRLVALLTKTKSAKNIPKKS